MTEPRLPMSALIEQRRIAFQIVLQRNARRNLDKRRLKHLVTKVDAIWTRVESSPQSLVGRA